MDVAGRTAVVVGAEHAFAGATVTALVAAGARVLALSRHAGHGAAFSAPVDVRFADDSDEAALERAFAEIAEEYGAIHALVAYPPNLASGIELDDGDTPERFAGAVEAGVLALVNSMRLATSWMIGNGPAGKQGERGVVIAVSSLRGAGRQTTDPTMAAVAAARTATINPAACEFAGRGIRFVAIEFADGAANQDELAQLIAAALSNNALNAAAISLPGIPR